MLELIQEAISSLQSEAAAYPSMVRVWMKVMALSFFSGVVFCWHKPTARAVVVSAILIVLGLIVSRIVFADISRSVTGAVLHIIIWIPLLIWMWRAQPRPTWKRSKSVFDRIYFIWLIWVSALMAVSLVLDVSSLIT